MSSTRYPRPAKESPARAYNAFNLASFAFGTKSGNNIVATITLTDARNQAPLGPVLATVYLSDNADGSTLTATALTGAITINSEGVLMGTPTSEKCVTVLSTKGGLFDLVLTQSASPQPYYLVVVLPDGSISVSPSFTF